jgi:hypothetical protein
MAAPNDSGHQAPVSNAIKATLDNGDYRALDSLLRGMRGDDRVGDAQDGAASATSTPRAT